MKVKHLLSLIVTGLVIVYAYSCSKSGSSYTPPVTGNDSVINITEMAFPATSTVSKGTTVKWTNNDAIAHTVTSDDGTTFNSGNLAPGASFSFKTNASGTIAYHCNYHSNMHGSLVVNP